MERLGMPCILSNCHQIHPVGNKWNIASLPILAGTHVCGHVDADCVVQQSGNIAYQVMVKGWGDLAGEEMVTGDLPLQYSIGCKKRAELISWKELICKACNFVILARRLWGWVFFFVCFLCCSSSWGSQTCLFNATAGRVGLAENSVEEETESGLVTEGVDWSKYRAY